MTRAQWWISLIALSVVLLALDQVTGPYILFPVTFVIPVGLAAWQLGRNAGFGFAVALSGIRFVFVLWEDAPGFPVETAITNSVLRTFVMLGLAYLIARLASVQAKLREQMAGVQTRLAAIVDTAQDSIISKDLNGIVQSWNAGAERMFGYTAAEMIGQPVRVLFPPDKVAAEDAILERIRRGERVESYETVRRRKDGTLVPVSLAISPIRDGAGAIVGASKIVRDITDRKRAEQQITESLREKEVLLKEIHHRVKNNLAVIGSLFYLQSSHTQDAQTLRILQDCQDRVRSMALVHERLYLTGDLAHIDFAEYMEELAKQLYRNYALTPHAIRLTLDLDKISLAIDRAIPCGLIVNELIANALKHAFPNGRTGDINVYLRKEEAGGLTLGVADTGVGLPDEATLQAQRSLGVRLLHSLAKQLDGRIEFIRHAPGTEACLILEASRAHES